MRTRPAAFVLATAAALTLGLTGCTAGAASPDVAPQALRNDAAQELAAAQGAVLVPVSGEVDQLTRARQRAVLARDVVRSAAAEQQLAAYDALTAAVEAAATPAAVRAAVAQSGLEVDRPAGGDDVLAG